MTVDRVAVVLLVAIALLSLACRKHNRTAGSMVDAAPMAIPAIAPSVAAARVPRNGEPVHEDWEVEFGCPPFGEAFASFDTKLLGVVSWGDDLIVAEGDRVERLRGVDGAKQALFDRSGLEEIERQGSDLLVVVRDGGRTWIERRSVEAPTTVTERRDLASRVHSVELLGEGWYLANRALSTTVVAIDGPSNSRQRDS